MFGDFREVDLPEIPENEYLSERGALHLRGILGLCAGVRQTGREVMAMMVPTNEDLCCALIQYQKGAEERAFQTWIAAGVLRYRWAPDEVLWICDVFTRHISIADEPEEVDRVQSEGLYGDPKASEGFCILHTRLNCGDVGGGAGHHPALRTWGYRGPVLSGAAGVGGDGESDDPVRDVRGLAPGPRGSAPHPAGSGRQPARGCGIQSGQSKLVRTPVECRGEQVEPQRGGLDRD